MKIPICNDSRKTKPCLRAFAPLHEIIRRPMMPAMTGRLFQWFLAACISLFVFQSLGNAADRKIEILPKEKRQNPVPFSQVRLEGELGARYMAATCNILTRTDRYSLETFASSAAGKPGALWWDWPGDQIGRWLSVAHVAEGYGWTPAAASRKAVAGMILPLQTKEGNFGPPYSATSDDVRIVSGNCFALRGLVDAYINAQDKRYLESARKLARYFETIAPQWEKRENGKLHEFYGHCLDGLVALYEQGGDRWALDLAKRLGNNATRTEHTHHSLSLCRGLIDLARVTSDKEYLAKAEDYLAWCREKQTASGGLPETMHDSKQDEGCGLADWIVVNLMMYQLTGNDRYLDDAEHTLVNHFFMNQFHTGGFGHRSLSPEIIGGKSWQGWDGQFGSENPGCCSFWGQWALGQLGQYIVTQSADAVSVNLYPSAEIRLPEHGMRLTLTSDFPRMKTVKIRVECEKPELCRLELRIPRWSRTKKVNCDGLDMTPSASGKRMLLTAKRKGILTADIDFGGEVRTVAWPAKGGDEFFKLPWSEDTRTVAVFDGPLCMGLSKVWPAIDLPENMPRASSARSSYDVDLPWALGTDAGGHPILDSLGRPQAIEPSSRTLFPLEPINARWLDPNVKDPPRRRILFKIQPSENRTKPSENKK